MDFVRLGEAGTYQYLPDLLIEGYNSLIWTERWQDHGDFELKSFDVVRLKNLLPEKTLVSHLDTEEVMAVETHSIEMVGEGEDAQPEITIKGRSITTIFEHRYVEANYQKKRKMRKKYSSTSAAVVLMVNAVNNDSGVDITRGDDDPDTEGVINDYPWTTKDRVPNVAIAESVAAEGETRWFQLEQGILYPQLTRILFDQDLGIRSRRPVFPNTFKIISVKTSLPTDRGTVIREQMDDISDIVFEVYDGIDRSSGTNAVKFSQLQGHVLNPQYLESNQDYKTALEVKSGEVEVKDVFREGDGGLTGWDRRVMDYDAGTPEIPPEPEKPEELKKNATKAERDARADEMDKWIDKHAKWKNKRASIIADFKEEAGKVGLRELKKMRRVDMFSGDISDLTPYIYKTHYFLGDTVLLVGDYKTAVKMIVQEYVRTEDANGDRGIPGLVAP